MKQTDTLIILGVLFLVSFLGLVHLNRTFPTMVRGYALDKLIDDLNPPEIKYGRMMDTSPNLYMDVTYEHFKLKLTQNENKTIVIDGNNLHLKYPNDERYYRYKIRVTVKKGFPLCECTWYNPISGETEYYGLVILNGDQRIIWVDN